MPRLVVCCLSVLSWIFGVLVANAASPPSEVAMFLENHCADCHGNGGDEGGFAIEQMDWEIEDAVHFQQWNNLLHRVESGEMPPAEASELSSDQRKHFVRQLSAPLINIQSARQRLQGRGRVRRLNRSEYETTLSDILATPLNIADMVPEDSRGDGFDTVGEKLNLSSVQMASYLEALDVAFDKATALHEPPQRRSRRLTFKNTIGIMQTYRRGGPQRVEDDGVIFFAPEKFSHANNVLSQWSAPHDGVYEIALSAYTVQSDSPVVLTLRAGGTGHSESQHVPSVALKHFVVPPGDASKPIQLSWRGSLQRGHFLHVSPSSLRPFRFGNNPSGFKTKLDYDGPGVMVQHIDIDGPILDAWPPRSHQQLWGGIGIEPIKGANPNAVVNQHLDQPMTRKAEPKLHEITPRPRKLRNNLARFFHDGPITFGDRVVGGEPIHRNQGIPADLHNVFWLHSDEPWEDAERLLKDFVPRAFRVLPSVVSEGDIEPYVAIARRWMKEGASFEAAMRTAYKAVLCSPQFLYRRDSLLADGDQPTRLANDAIAERLSYFLWNGPADEALLSADLCDATVRRKQAERLLVDGRRQRFERHLLDEWFDLRLLDFTVPDSKLYPEHDDLLQWSIEAETREFFAKLLREDQPAKSLIDTDWVMLNWRLANHYGLRSLGDTAGVNDVDGMAMRSVSLNQSQIRGGLLTQASILKVTANGTTTSPVIRGLWVLDKIMGTPPPPPPPGIPAIEPDIRGATTITEQLDRHRAEASCAMCHDRIDPPGLALESFDVIGQQRRHYRKLDPKLADQKLVFSVQPRPDHWMSGPPVETSGELDGKSFRGIRDFKRMLIRQERALARNVVTKFIIYATGAAPTIADRSAVESILDQSRQTNYGVRTLLLNVVASDLFTQK